MGRLDKTWLPPSAFAFCALPLIEAAGEGPWASHCCLLAPRPVLNTSPAPQACGAWTRAGAPLCGFSTPHLWVPHPSRLGTVDAMGDLTWGSTRVHTGLSLLPGRGWALVSGLLRPPGPRGLSSAAGAHEGEGSGYGLDSAAVHTLSTGQWCFLVPGPHTQPWATSEGGAELEGLLWVWGRVPSPGDGLRGLGDKE